MSDGQRVHISNGIWLCGNCHALIDRNPATYPVQLLQRWKAETETEMLAHIQGRIQIERAQQGDIPFIELDMTWAHGGRWIRGYSDKNKTEEIDGQQVMIIDHAVPPIINLYNNSTQPAFNIRIEEIDGSRFNSLDKLNKINNIQPLDRLELAAEIEDYMEGTYIEADQRILDRYPERLQGMQWRITYRDGAMQDHETISTFENAEFVNVRIK
jgi:hypothetical protein